MIHRGTRLDYLPKACSIKFQNVRKPVFITVARLIEEKGVDDALRVFSHVAKNNPNAVLYIAGEGPFKLNLESLAANLNISSNVIFLGHIEHKTLISFMAESHVFLLMSRYKSERLPNVVKEAMYQKCIVITTDTVGIDELISHEKDGFIVSKGDVEVAARYAKSCIDDQGKGYEIAQRAQEKIISSFDVSLSMKKYYILWKSILEAFRT